MAGGSLIAAWLLGASALALLPAAEIEVEGPVRIGDVAGLDALAPELRARIAPREIALLPEGRSRVTLSRAALAGLIRRRVPGLEVAAGDGEVTLRRRLAPAAGPAPDSCFALSRAAGAGEALRAEDVAPAPCRAGAAAGVVAYDARARALRARTDLAAGAYLGRVVLPEPPAVAAGETLTLTSRAGPVRIERGVVALQTGRRGGRLFVRTEDGEVLAVPLAEEGR